MSLVEKICSEIGVSRKRLMLLRHSSGRIERLRRFGGSVEEYTAIQPVGSKYDFKDHPPQRSEVVAVIVEDKLYGVFRVQGIAEEGTTRTLGSAGYRAFELHIKKPERKALRYDLVRVHTTMDKLRLTGWEKRERTTVQRSDGAFFDEIEVEPPAVPQSADEIIILFDQNVQRSLLYSSSTRRTRLLSAPVTPKKVTVQTTVFIRNEDVVAEVLFQAKGKCGACKKDAPFVRQSNATPYLEVHHINPLANNGEDTVENAIALCPNCHRKAHFGPHS